MNGSREALRLDIPVDDESVGALSLCPTSPIARLVLAHGAGAGMEHPFMSALARGLAERQVATLRFEFPSMARGAKRPDPPAVAQAAVRAAVDAAATLDPALPLVAGGKSFGGRMTSQAQAASPLPGVRGLVFVGFPLHAAGKPAATRATHLRDVRVPMLFLQGSRDALADPATLRPVLDALADRATLVAFEHAEHAFHVPARSGITDAQVLARLLDAAADWIAAVVR